MASEFSSPRSVRIADVWGHFAPEALGVCVVAAIAVGLHPATSPLTLTAPLGLLAFVLASWVLMRRHDRRLCELCMAAMPLNAAEQATRYRRRFWLAHTLSRPVLLVPYLVVLIGSNFLIGRFGPLGTLVWASAQLSMIYLIVSHSSHRRLQPWCSWCSGDGGGSEHEDVPGPLPIDRHQLV